MTTLRILSAIVALVLSASAQVSTLTMHGEYDFHTNAPSITIYYPNGSSVNVGTNWAQWRPVTNGVIWDVAYPATDCQTNSTLGASSPVILNGVYTNIANGITNQDIVWFRLPVGYSGARFVFYIDPSTPYSMQSRCIELRSCLPSSDHQTLSRLSVWGNVGPDYTFWGTTDLPEQSILDLATGTDFGLMLLTNHEVSAFALTTDYNTYSQMNPTEDLTNIVQIACGSRHALALRDTGTVVAWGDGQDGQTRVPTNLTGVAAVACGSAHSLALRTNGTVVAWGSPLYGCTNVPAGLSNVVQVAGGSYFSAALKADGTVAVWGDTSYGVTNIPSGLAGVVRITCGNRHVTALKTNGTVVAWGSGFSSPSAQNVVYTISGDTGYWLVLSNGTVTMEGYDNVVSMPWMVTNVVHISARGSSHAAISGPVLLGIQSRGSTNANVTWPAAVAGRIATATTLGSSWSLATNTVKYVREQKHIHLANSIGESTRFFRMTTNSTPIGFGLGEDFLAPAPVGTNNWEVPNPPSMLESIMLPEEDNYTGSEPPSPPWECIPIDPLTDLQLKIRMLRGRDL